MSLGSCVLGSSFGSVFFVFGSSPGGVFEVVGMCFRQSGAVGRKLLGCLGAPGSLVSLVEQT